MNSRRNFFKNLSVVAAGFSILPSALSYNRNWVKPAGIWTATTLDLETYKRIPFYLVELEVNKYNSFYSLIASTSYKPNMGEVIRSVRA